MLSYFFILKKPHSRLHKVLSSQIRVAYSHAFPQYRLRGLCLGSQLMRCIYVGRNRKIGGINKWGVGGRIRTCKRVRRWRRWRKKVTDFPLRSSVCNLNNTMFNIRDGRWSWRRWRDRERERERGKKRVRWRITDGNTLFKCKFCICHQHRITTRLALLRTA